MNTIPLLLAGVILLGAAVSARSAEVVAATFDAGGGRVGSDAYVIDGSLGSLGGVATATAGSPAVVARHGYAGQLYDVRTLAVTAEPAAVPETGTTQLAASAIMDDTTRLPLTAKSVVWSAAGAPIVAISDGGLAATTNVYQTTAATVRADYQSTAGFLAVSVLNTGDDDFGLYAGDGMEDAWQARYFGEENPAARPDSDPDGDHVDNGPEYVADTDPTDALSFFTITRAVRLDGFGVFFQSSASRRYTLFTASDPALGPWTAVPSQSDIPGTGAEQSLVDPAPVGPPRFHRLGVRIP